MNIHEYQAKKLFRLNGVPVPDGYLAQSGTEAEFAMRRLGSKVGVVKAAGGVVIRGKKILFIKKMVDGNSQKDD